MNDMTTLERKGKFSTRVQSEVSCDLPLGPTA